MPEIDLDASQKAAAHIAPEDRQVVLAGPGAGKTEVVGAIAAHLVDHGGIYPEEILVLSFSRVAVGVVRERTKDVTSDGEYVDVSTLDSFAARIIDDLGEKDMEFRGFDENIRRATALLQDADPYLENYRHVVIDEVQDVVGARADFVLTLLTESLPSDAGFSLLGDPLQGIYDFQTGEGETSNEQFFDAVQERLSPEIRELHGHHRGETDDARRIALARPDLMQMRSPERLGALKSELLSVPPLGSIDEDIANALETWRGTTAFLCDTNILAAFVTAELAEAGVVADRLEPAQAPRIISSLGRILSGHDGRRLGRDDFLARARSAGEAEPEGLWRAMAELTDSGREIDLAVLAEALSRRVPSELAWAPDGVVQTSTVHRAKGREFDNVILVDPEAWERPDELSEAQANVLFVALTRARSRLATVSGPRTDRWYRLKEWGADGRWAKKAYRNRRIMGVLLEANDTRPPSGGVPEGLRLGAEPVWHLEEDGYVDVAGEPLPRWEATVDDRIVAVTTYEFGEFIQRFVPGRRPEIHGGRVQGWETRAFQAPADGEQYFMSAARVAGPVEFEWS